MPRPSSAQRACSKAVAWLAWLSLSCMAAGLPAPEARADEQCAEDPQGLGARKGVQRRDFLKRLRVELSAFGGFFASDLMSTSYSYGGAVGFYPFEDLGIEASLVVSQFQLDVEKPLTQFFAGQVYRPSLAYIVVGNVVWSPIHLKMRVSERGIVHGDAFLSVGAGDTIHPTVQGLTFDVGIGLKLYPTRWLAVRLDVRDYVLLQEAIGVQRITNNVVGMLGLSVFLPGPREKKK